MKHIRENKRKIGEKIYWKSDNTNIVKGTWTEDEEIHLDKLNARIVELEDLIANFKPASYPINATEEQKRAIDEFNQKGEPAEEWIEGLAMLKELKKEIT